MQKILMFSTTWDNKYTSELIDGVEEAVIGTNTEVHVVNAFESAQTSSYYQKEGEIFLLPDVDSYDGIILALNGNDSVRAVEGIIRPYIEAGKPVISIDQEIEGATFCGIDNYSSMYKLVEHMVIDHKAKVINYVGGPEDHQENISRLRALKDCLDAHGIELDPKRVRNYRFLRADGQLAYEDFKRMGMEAPDVVICANDYMAVGYIEAAMRDGHDVPNDFAVTGFDNVNIGQTFYPSVTSINRNRHKAGLEATKRLMQMIKNGPSDKPVLIQGRIKLNESCGCRSRRDYRADYQDMILLNEFNQNMSNIQEYVRNNLCSKNSFEGFMLDFGEGCEAFKIEEMAICINRSFFDGMIEKEQKGFTDSMNYYSSNVSGNFKRSEEGIFPVYWNSKNESKIFILSPLHFGSQSFGYTISEYDETFFRSGNYRTFMNSISLALENISQRIAINGVNLKLQKLYVRDSLTDLLNRFGYAAYAGHFFEKNFGRVYIVYIDLDDLKKINDKYGHAMGDVALKGIAAAICSAFADTDIRVRMGGDEFLVMGAFISDEDVKSRIATLDRFLENYTHDNQLEFAVSASVGFVINNSAEESTSLEELVKRADNCMYEIKQKKKKVRE
ncbi:MAG: GGDEF domain-containing protein [Lachnospiraceae bacterium]|nr:GGDEF domain-containing protein [Lachnospiraceae bacterium]